MKLARRLCIVAALCLPLALSGCMPVPAASTSTMQATTYPFQADFSDAGVTWVAGGRAYVARAPAFTVQEAALPTPATAVAWAGNTPWAALNDVGLVVTLDGPAQQLRAPQVWKLSHTRIYTRSGAAMDYSGTPASGFPFTPQAVITAPDGQDYALNDGHIYQNAAPFAVLLPEPVLSESGLPGPAAACTSNVPTLYATALGVSQAACPTVWAAQRLYRITAGELQQLSSSVGSAGEVLRRVPYPVPAPLSAALGQVGEYLVALRSDGQLRVFMPDLREVSP